MGPASSVSWAFARRRRSRSSSAWCRSSRRCWSAPAPSRFLMRIHDPSKQWKLSPMDVESRRLWEAYTSQGGHAGAGEGIHQMRVAVRGLLSAIRMFAPVLRLEDTRGLFQALKTIFTQLGGVREADVFIAETL